MVLLFLSVFRPRISNSTGPQVLIDPGDGEGFYDKVDAVVEKDGKTYTFADIYAGVTYNIGYRQMDVSHARDDDESRIGYKKLGLHLGYNTNFQQFSWDGRYLSRRDGEGCIMVRFR